MNLVLPDLEQELRTLLAKIPRGRVTTYGELARALGDLRAARWVGEYLLDHPHSARCACHRVVRTTGEIGKFIGGDTAEKRALLVAEGLAIRDGVVGLDPQLQSADFGVSPPLAPLIEFQEDVRQRVRMSSLPFEPELACGLDVAYRTDGTAVGAAVLLRLDDLSVVWQGTRRMPSRFPYIPGYLAFRELPMLLALWDEARSHASSATVCFVDGNGRLHPRRAGVASCFGVVADVPTIGIGKSLLCGRIEASGSGGARVVHEGEEIATVMEPRAGGKPIYVSVGDRITLEEATTLVRRTLAGRRLPAPIALADRLSKVRKGDVEAIRTGG